MLEQSETINAGLPQFHDTYRKFPFGMLRADGTGWGHPEWGGSGQNRRYALMHQLTPYIEQSAFYNAWDQLNYNNNTISNPLFRGDGTTVLPTNGTAAVGQLLSNVLRCPSNPGSLYNQSHSPTGNGIYARADYYGCAGQRGYPGFNATRPSLWNPFGPGNDYPRPAGGRARLPWPDPTVCSHAIISIVSAIAWTEPAIQFCWVSDPSTTQCSTNADHKQVQPQP